MKPFKPFYCFFVLCIYVFLTIILPVNVFAAEGDYVFVKKQGGTSSDQGKSVAVDSTGAIYTTGYFQGTADFDPGAGTSNLVSLGGYDIFVSKLDSSGNFVWAKQIAGTDAEIAYSIAVDASGSTYITGNFYGTVDFDPGAGTANLTSAGWADIFVLKLDSSGNFVWVKRVQGVGRDSGNALVLDASNNIYVTGYFGDTADFDPGAGTSNLTAVSASDVFILKLDPSGNFVWAKRVGADYEDDIGNGVTVDTGGNVYTVGSFKGTVDFDPGAGTSNISALGSDSDIFILKLDSAGNFAFAKTFRAGSSNQDATGNAIKVDSSGNIYTTGAFQGNVDFDPGAGTSNLTSNGNSDIFISKLDSSGNFVWAKQIGGFSGDAGDSITLDSDGAVYTTGFFQSTVDFDPGAGTSNLSSFGLYEAFVSKLDSAGNFVWADKVGSSGYDEGASIFFYGDSVYITGYFQNTADFDPGAGSVLVASAGSDDIFTLKIKAIIVDSAPPSVTLTAPEDETLLFGTTTLSASASDDIGVVGVQFKIDGVNIEAEDTTAPYGITWDSTTVADGTYTIAAVARDAVGNFATSTVQVTIANNPTVTTGTVSSITSTTVTLNGSIVSIGAGNAVQHGFAYGISPDLSTVVATSALGSYTGTGNFTQDVVALTPSTTYYVRAYVTNSVGTGYGSVYSFTTAVAPATTPLIIGPIGGSSSGPSQSIPESLQQQPIQTTSTSQQTPSFTKILQPNTEDAAVKDLQKFLNSQGFPVSKKGPGSKGKETTLFGPATKAAVIKFQKANKITPANGAVGPKTRAKMNEIVKKRGL